MVVFLFVVSAIVLYVLGAVNVIPSVWGTTLGAVFGSIGAIYPVLQSSHSFFFKKEESPPSAVVLSPSTHAPLPLTNKFSSLPLASRTGNGLSIPTLFLVNGPLLHSEDFYGRKKERASLWKRNFCGVQPLSEIGAKSHTPWVRYFVNVQTLQVGFLESEETYQLITEPVQRTSGKDVFGEEAIKKIKEYTNGHPFLIQALCSAIIDLLNRQKRDVAQLEDIHVAFEDVLEGWGDTYFRDMWDRTTAKQRRCLSIFKSIDQASIQRIAQKAKLSESITRDMLHSLIKRNLVVQEQGFYRIAVPIFRAWIKQNTWCEPLVTLVVMYQRTTMFSSGGESVLV